MSDTNIQLNKPSNTYIYKKTEKLVSALYLLTSFISDREPVKWQLREAGLKLLSQILNLSDKPVQGVPLITLILSLLEVAYLGGIISQMNHDILRRELENLIQAVGAEEKAVMGGAVFSPDFFNTPLISKGQDNMSDRLAFVQNKLSVRKEVKKENKSNRQDLILSLLRAGGELGIKDFTTSIKDCSEKTIQRELISLVSKGQVKKMGEKRWSRYSLK